MEFLKKFEVPLVLAVAIVLFMLTDFAVFVAVLLGALFLDWLLGWPMSHKIEAWVKSAF